ncbi:MAG: thioredoxin [Gaiellales bacterium]
MATIAVTQASFQTDVVDSPLPVLIDLWAPWCGPCRQVAPVLEQMAEAYAGRLVVAKVNVDEEPELAAAFGVRGIPTMLLLQGGQVVETMVGAGPQPVIEQQLNLAAHLPAQTGVA